MPKNSKIVLTKKDITEFVRNLFYFFFLEMFFIFMHVCINNSEGKDRCLPLYLPFHMEDYAIDIFPIKKMKCDFHQLPQSKKEKSNQQWKIGPNIFLYFSCQSNKMSSITFIQIGFFHNFLAFFAKKEQN